MNEYLENKAAADVVPMIDDSGAYEKDAVDAELDDGDFDAYMAGNVIKDSGKYKDGAVDDVHADLDECVG